ncbi:MAG: hypothetical protein N2595_07390, partial [bacterium]|nr:hypothetical protein [bacterium]
PPRERGMVEAGGIGWGVHVTMRSPGPATLHTMGFCVTCAPAWFRGVVRAPGPVPLQGKGEW